MSASFATTHNQDELQAIQTEIRKTKASMLNSVNTINGVISETEIIADNTANDLVVQREKLQNISKRCDDIDPKLVTAQRNLNKLGSVFGGIKNYFHRPKGSLKKSASQPQLSNYGKNKTTTANPADHVTDVKLDSDTYLGKPRSAMDDMEHEIEDGLRYSHLAVHRLYDSALNMNRELESQKILIDDVSDKAKRLNDNVNKKNKDMKKISLP